MSVLRTRPQPLLPTNEQTLMRFCAHLVDQLHHTSIKVYLSAVHSLHIDYGFPDPLINCLQLQHLLRRIKRYHGSNLPQHQPVTVDPMSVLHQSLDFNNPDNVMLWAACCLGFYGFLRAGEFTVNGTFDPSLHLTMADVQVDSINPQSFRVFIKCSKTDPFRKGCFIFLGCGSLPLCPLISLTKLSSSPRARHWSSLYLPEWHSSLQISAVFLSSNYPTITSYPWKVLKP